MFFSCCVVRSRTLLQVHEDYGVDEPVDPTSLLVNNSDYLKAVHKVTINPEAKSPSDALGEISMAVGSSDGSSSDDRPHADQPINTAKR